MARMSSVVSIAATWLLLAAAASAALVNLGPVTHVVGNGNNSGGVDASGTAALLNTPTGCMFDGSNNLYFADTTNNVVRRIAAGGDTTTTWIGAMGQLGNSISAGNTRLQSPTDVVLSADGTKAYVADYALNIIFTATINVPTTLAYYVGNSGGLAGNADGTGTSAFLDGPQSIAVRNTGSAVVELYVTEARAHRVRKIVDTVTTIFAGSTVNVSGSTDATGTAASFNTPRGIAIVQSTSMVYVADSLNRKVRLINSGGVVTTIAGDGTAGNNDGVGTAARFVTPYGLVLDSSARYLYIADKGNNEVRRLTVSSNQIDTVMGNLAIGWTQTLSSVTSMIGAPAGVCLYRQGNQQRLYVTGDHSIAYAATRRTRTETMTLPSTPAPPTTTTTAAVTTTGAPTTTISATGAALVNLGPVTHVVGNGNNSGGVDGSGTAALLNTPTGCMFDGSNNLYFADTTNNVVRRIAAGSDTTTTWIGAIGQLGNSVSAGNTRLQSPTDVVLSADGTKAYVADYALNIIFTATINVPTTLAYYVGNSGGLAGNTDGTGTSAFLDGPQSIAVRNTGSAVVELYVTEARAHRVRKIVDTVTIIFAGSTVNVSGSTDATGTAARFNTPRGIAIVQSTSMVYVADSLNRKVRLINSGGVVTTVAGDGTAGNNDGVGTAARFVTPYGLVLDSSARYLFIADKGNNEVRRLTVSSNQIDTVMGNLAIGWTQTLSSVTSMIGAPAGVCLYRQGNQQRLYVTGDHSIAYAATRRTRTETMTLPSTPAPPTTTTTAAVTTTGAPTTTIGGNTTRSPLTTSPNATVPSVSAAPALPSIIIALVTIAALLIA
jgi:DNA-binding beta-propeller fold protein YncE